MAIVIRLGSPADVEVAASVYERSNLARRQGVWPEQASRIKHVAARLREPSSWFLLAEDGSWCVGMAAVEPMRGGDGAGAVVPGVLFLNLVYVVPERWGRESAASCWTLSSMKRAGGATRGFTSGPMSNRTNARTGCTAAMASPQPDERRRMARERSPASGHSDFPR